MTRRTARLLLPGDIIGLDVTEEGVITRPAEEGNTTATISSKQGQYDDEGGALGYDFITDAGLFYATPGQTFPLVEQ